MKVLKLFVIVSIIIIALPNLSFAGGPCGCYCGIYLPAPCSDDACKQACGWRGGGTSAPAAPAYDYEAERQRQEAERLRLWEAQQQRQREVQEQQRMEEEAAKQRQVEFEQNKENALKGIKDITEEELGLKGTDTGGLGLKDIGDTGKSNLGLKELEDNKTVKDKKMVETRQKGWQKALGCAIQEAYSRAESLGPDGVIFAQDLRNEMTRVFNEAGQPVEDKNDVNVVSLKLDRQLSTGSGSDEKQFYVEVAVHSKGNGEVVVDVQSYFSKSQGKKDKQENLQSILVLNKDGKVIKGDKSAMVNACLTH
jgi:hypothetical protein